MSLFIRIIALPVSVTRLTLLFVVMLIPILGGHVRADLFGISIPAHYGTWFTNIYRLYTSNQQLVAQARELYTQYLAVTRTLDALEHLGSARDLFADRWRDNVRVLVAANIAWELDQNLLEGRVDLEDLLGDLIGLEIDGDQVRLRPEIINLAAVRIAGDPDRWRDYLQINPIALPATLVPYDVFREHLHYTLHDQSGNAFLKLNARIQRDAALRLQNSVAQQPALYLGCADQDPCWSPIDGPARPWSEMLVFMYQRNHPLHQPRPLAHEHNTEGREPVDLDAYLHRRVSSAVWQALGVELAEKLDLLHQGFAQQRHRLLRAAADVETLAHALRNALQPLDDWTPDGNGLSLAGQFAASLGLGGEGSSRVLAQSRSFIDGLVDKKLSLVLDRARQIEHRLAQHQGRFAALQAQIQSARAQQPPSSSQTPWDPAYAAAGLTANRAPPAQIWRGSILKHRLQAWD